jgi:hypothetical protein
MNSCETALVLTTLAIWHTGQRLFRLSNEYLPHMARASLGVLPDSARNLVWSDLGFDALESLIQSVLLFRGENLFGQR